MCFRSPVRGIAAAVFAAVLSALPSGALAQSVGSAGGFTSDNVQWVTIVPIRGTGWMPFSGMGWTNSGSGRVVNDHLFVWAEGVVIYDISDPLAPRFVDYIRRPTPGYVPEQVEVAGVADIGRFDTNGEIMLIPSWDRADSGSGYPRPDRPTDFALYVYDVSDPANAKEIGKLGGLPYPGTAKVTVGGPFCILDCTWAYDRWGAIIDLREPARPKTLRRLWTRGLKMNNTTDGLPGASELVEVAPGRVLTGSHPMYLLDVSHPARPKVIARSDGSPSSRGDIAWPDYPNGDTLISTNLGEGSWSRCDMADEVRETSAQSVFSTWTSHRWRETELIERVDDYRLRNGTYIDGDPAFSGGGGVSADGHQARHAYSTGCRFGRFDLRPTGAALEVAAAAHGHGVKFFQVTANGKIELADWFLGHAANVINVLWANDEVVYALDANRGIDVLRVNR